jgi:heme A synthase
VNAVSPTTTSWTTRNKIGLGLAIFYAITNIPSVITPTGDNDGPPMAIMVICSVLAVVATIAGVFAWRRNSRPAARLTAASLIVITLTSLPAFFVDVPGVVKAMVAAGVLLTVAIVVLMFSTGGRSAEAGSRQQATSQPS